MKKTNPREFAREYRHRRIRKRLLGTLEKPRLSVHRSHKNIYIQIIDDVKAHTLLSLSTQDKAIKNIISKSGNIEAATILGEHLARKALEKGIKEVAFDRGGYLYHGRVKALAEAARKAGLVF